MPNPYKAQSIQTAETKHRQIVGSTDKMEVPSKKAARLSGVEPKESGPPPEMAVPQFENDRSPQDPKWGSAVPKEG